jgi:hypothetical protein
MGLDLTADTEPPTSPDVDLHSDPALPGELPIGDLVLREVRALVLHVQDLRGAVAALTEDVRAVRHAVAVVADGELERRQRLDALDSRLDVLEVDGCARGRVLHGRGNGSR